MWIDFARQIELAGADALELNVYFLETSLEYNPDEIRDLYVNIIRKVKETVSIPVIMKIGKNVGNIPALVNTLKVNGADGVVMFNRFYQPDIDINNMQIVSGNVFSNHSDLSDTIRWTAIISGKVPRNKHRFVDRYPRLGRRYQMPVGRSFCRTDVQRIIYSWRRNHITGTYLY